MVQQTSKPASGVVSAMRRIYNPLGFSKGYNFAFWFITMGYLFGFTLARLQYFSYYGIFCNPEVHGISGASPGECYYYLQDPYKIGMMLHLFSILPAACLVVLQFTPVIRHKAIIFHRLNGYAVIILSLIANAGALITLPHAFGGDLTTRVWGGVTVISTTGALLFAFINIKLLQIDQHRAWMMRAWAYFSTIVTIRMIMFSSAAIISGYTSFSTTYPCAQIDFTLGEEGTSAAFPDCVMYYNGTNPEQRVVVYPNMDSENPIEIAAALGISFGTAGWLALWIHAILIEFYLRLTPAETTRLRQVSYERQLARGFSRPGNAGLVAERFGDAECPKPQQLASVEREAESQKQMTVSSLSGVDGIESGLRV